LDLAPETEKKLAQFEQLRQQYQTIATQIVQYRQMIREIDRAKDEMENLDKDSKVYKEIGALLIEVDDKAKLTEELDEKKEAMEVRLKGIEGQEAELKKILSGMQSDLESELSGEN